MEMVKQPRIDARPADRRQDVVVEVKFHAQRRMPHRRNLMAPLVVIAPIVIVKVGFAPARGHQSLLGVDRFVASCGQSCFVASLLQFQFERLFVGKVFDGDFFVDHVSFNRYPK